LDATRARRSSGTLLLINRSVVGNPGCAASFGIAYELGCYRQLPRSRTPCVLIPRRVASGGNDIFTGSSFMKSLCFVFLVLLTPALIAQMNSLLIEDMTWTEVRDAIAAGKTTAIHYAGSTEQNGPGMALGNHNFIAHYLGPKIAAQLGNALVYPTPLGPTGDWGVTGPGLWTRRRRPITCDTPVA